MSKPEPTFTCATCDVAIAWHPTFHLGLAFCCAGCAADGPCLCSYDHDEPVADPRPVPAVASRPTSHPVEPVPAAAVAEDDRILVGVGR